MRIPSAPIMAIILAALVSTGILVYANHRLAVASPGGIDFLTHWVGTRALFHGESPYSGEVAVSVQKAYYGHPARPGENEFLNPYMLHSAIIFAPFALIPDFTWARATWMTFLELSTVATFLISMRITDWRPKAAALIVLLVYAALGYHSVRPVINGNVTTAMALLMVCAIRAIQIRKDALAGVLIALFLAKPNLAAVPVLFITLWSLAAGRWRFLASLSGSFLFMCLVGWLIVPGWPAQNIANILHYGSYNPPTTLAAALNELLAGVGRWVGFAIYAALVAILLPEWIGALRRAPDAFLPAFCLTLVAAQWLWISTDPGNFVILTLSLIFILKALDRSRAGPLGTPLLLLALLVGLWALFLATADRANGNLQSPVMFLPLPAVLLLGFYLQGRGARVSGGETRQAI